MDFKDITDETLELKLKSAEHDFVERKAKNDRGGWLQTAVAFANSTPIGWPAFLFVGVDDAGTPQLETAGLESQMKKVSDTLEAVFPAIYRLIVPIHLEDRCCLAVIIPGSEARPHFAGLPYVRVGDQTKPATEDQFAQLLAQRTSKPRELLMWKGKAVTVEHVVTPNADGLYPVPGKIRTMVLLDCNQFYVTVEIEGHKTSHTLRDTELSFDHNEDRIKLEFRD
jgi:predicted HTH transcriptional regulator